MDTKPETILVCLCDQKSEKTLLQNAKKPTSASLGIHRLQEEPLCARAARHVRKNDHLGGFGIKSPAAIAKSPLPAKNTHAKHPTSTFVASPSRNRGVIGIAYLRRSSTYLRRNRKPKTKSPLLPQVWGRRLQKQQWLFSEILHPQFVYAEQREAANRLLERGEHQ